MQIPDPTLVELDTIRTNLAGVGRVFLSGGEPLLRKDLGKIVDVYTGDFILGIPTNATRGLRHAKSMVGKVAFVNVGLEGPRATTNRVRGDYDQVTAGVCAKIEWFPADMLPLNTYPYTAACVRAFRDGAAFALSGWAQAAAVMCPPAGAGVPGLQCREEPPGHDRGGLDAGRPAGVVQTTDAEGVRARLGEPCAELRSRL